MRRAARLMLLGLTLAIATTAAAYQWPIVPFNQQHEIFSGVGDLRAVTNPFLELSIHDGVDIAADPDTQVFPVVSGYISEVNTTDKYTKVGAYKYQLIEPDFYLVGWPVAVGSTRLGVVVQDPTVLAALNEEEMDSHLHFSDGLNPLNAGLSPYVDKANPSISIEGVFTNVNYPSFTLLDGTLFPDFQGDPLVSGQVNIKAQASDPSVKADGTAGSASMGLFKFGYQVLNQSGGLLSETVPCSFGSSGVARPEMIYAVPTTTSPFNYAYWVSNGCGSHSWWSSTSVPDGRYKIRAMAADVQNGFGSRPPYIYSSALNIVVDNNPPAISNPAPANGSSIGGLSLSIQADLADIGTEVESATMSLDGNVVATEGSGTTFISFTPPSLLSAGSHSVIVSATDAAGHASNLSWSFTVVDDTTPPSVPSVIAAGMFTNNPTKLDASWASSDDESGISNYFVAVGVSPGGAEVYPFTSFGTATSGSVNGLDLSLGATYYISVYAVNGSGLSGAVGSSAGVLVTNSRPHANADGPYGGFAQKPITLDGSMSFDVDGDTLTYRWSFGDGAATSTAVKPTHTYVAPGTYNVSLIVNDGYTDSTPSTSTVNITPFFGISKIWTTASDFTTPYATSTVIESVSSSLPGDADVKLELGPEFLAVDQSAYTREFNALQMYTCSVYAAAGPFKVSFYQFAPSVPNTAGMLVTRFQPFMRRTGHSLNAFFQLQNLTIPAYNANVSTNTGVLDTNFSFVDIPIPNLPLTPFDQVAINDTTNPQSPGNGGGDYYYSGTEADAVPAGFGGVFANACDPQLFGWSIGKHAWTFKLYGRRYPSSGWVYSAPFDVGTDSVTYGPLLASDSKPKGQFAIYRTGVNYFTQTSSDGIFWDPAMPVTPGQFVQSAGKRFIRWSGNLTNNDNSKTPSIHDVTVSFHTYNPPGAPTQIAANGSNPSPWSSLSTFTVTLSTPVHLAGIGGALFKVGAPPNSNSEGTFVAGVTTFSYFAPVLVNGSNALNVWLQDTLGNASTAYSQVVYVRFDDLPAVSAAAAPSTAAAGPFNVSFNSADNGADAIPPTGSGLSSTYLWFRRDHAGDGLYGAWQRLPSGVPGGGAATSSGTFSFDAVSYDAAAPDGNYQFYTQAADVAGNLEANPVSTTTAKAETYFDRTAPLISNIITPSILPASALVQWNTDDLATGYVDYGTTTAFGFKVNASTQARSQLVSLNCQLLYPATIYYRVTATNQTGLVTASSTRTLNTPILVTVPTDPFGVVAAGESVVIQINNPGLSTGTFEIDGQTGEITLSSSGVFQLVLSSTLAGSQTLNITVGGFTFSTQFIVDTATRAVRLARFVVDGGGVMTSTDTTPGSSLLDATVGQFVQGPPVEQTASAAMASNRSRVFGGYYSAIDPVSPDPVTDLAAMRGPGRGEAKLSWTTPGDDAGVGQAMVYDLRYATFSITDTSFYQSTAVALSTYPASAGTAQQAVVGGLADETTYYFAIKALDELRNTVAISNVSSTATYSVAESTDLTGGKPTVALLSNVQGIAIDKVSTTTFNPAVVLATSAAAAQGLVFASPVYDILSPVNPLPGGATIQFHYDPSGLDPGLEQELRIYHFITALNSWVLLSDVPPILSDDLLIAQVDSFSLFAVMLRDRVPPVTSVNYSDGHQFVGTNGAIFVSTPTFYQLAATDPNRGPRPGVGVAFTRFRVDGSTGAFAAWTSTGSFLRFPQGLHTLDYFSGDFAGNIESTKSIAISVDGASPVALLKASSGPFALLADGISLPTHTLLVSVHDPLTAGTSLDGGSGISTATYALDGSTLTVTGSSFTLTLATGTHFLEVFLADNVGNVMDRSSSSSAGAFRVLVGGDAQAPRTSLIAGVPSLSTSVLFATDLTAFSLYAVDDLLEVGDSAGLGVSETLVAVDTTNFSVYGGPFFVVGEGTHTVSYFSVDLTSHTESTRTTTIALDVTSPVTLLQPIGFSTTNAQGIIFATTGTMISLSAIDSISGGVASGVSAIYYVVDTHPFSSECESVLENAEQPSGTCANELYAGPFTLQPGTHTVYYFAQDGVDNQEEMRIASVTVQGPGAINILQSIGSSFGGVTLSWSAPGEL